MQLIGRLHAARAVASGVLALLVALAPGTALAAKKIKVVATLSVFGNIVREHRRAEIGWTWLGTEFQRTALNTEAKYLMFRHAFETWGLMRVELKTGQFNEKSQAAMRRLGLVYEGTFRKWMFNEDGSIRDAVWFAVTDDEWPEMKARLEAMMATRA